MTELLNKVELIVKNAKPAGWQLEDFEGLDKAVLASIYNLAAVICKGISE